MEDVKIILERAMREGEPVGRLIAGLAVLRETCREIVLIVEGEEPLRIATDALGVSFGSITLHGRPLIPFDRLSGWDRPSGSPCIAFSVDGRDAIIAPGRALDARDIARTVERFAGDRGPGSDTVYVNGLDWAGGRAGRELTLADGVLTALGEALPVADMAWADAEADGDGNDHLHVVMADGRYRRIAVGDLGR